ncbi:Tetraspanin [Aphelenchoides besseyi]|nr:Tetraspanin [Aphelenchoides besseyi]
MVYGVGNNLTKFLVFTTNFLLFVFGGLIFGFSLWANLDQNFAQHLSELMRQAKIDVSFIDQLEQYQASLWILVAIGGLLFFVGFLGCCGAACESIVLLTLFFIIVSILSVIELFALVYLLVNKNGFLTALYQGLEKSSETPLGIQNLKPIEKLLSCCGATAETAFKYQCAEELKMPDCYTVISSKLDEFGSLVVTIGVLLLIVQSFALIFSCVLCRAFRERAPAYYA